jgi:PPK2 family polyphosphate:nucleotide phosphotransferase
MMNLKKIKTSPHQKFSQEECNKELSAFHKKLFELQNVFYADARFALLIIIQGVDTSGKDGTIRHVMTCMNPMGVAVKSFKKPTAEESNHDFLWRVYPHFPAKGMIAVFNRSYYEDILVPALEDRLSKKEFHFRCELFNRLEQHLESSNIHVLKFFLHLSKEEQKTRIKERFTQPHKRWKYEKEDAAAADKWAGYMEVYNELINKCSTAKWHIIPADKKWYRNYAVAKIITEHLESLKLKYPK